MWRSLRACVNSATLSRLGKALLELQAQTLVPCNTCIALFWNHLGRGSSSDVIWHLHMVVALV